MKIASRLVAVALVVAGVGQVSAQSPQPPAQQPPPTQPAPAASQPPAAPTSQATPRGVQPAPPPTQASAAAAAVKPPDDYIIGAADVLIVGFWREKDMSAEVIVRPDGKITLPLINDMMAAGLTPDQLREKVTEAAAKFIDLPVSPPSVYVKEINSRKVFITGEVEKQGEYKLTGPITVLKLIAMAGGFKEYAKKDRILIIRSEKGRDFTFTFDYEAVMQRQKLQTNIELKPGDTVVVP